MIKISNRERCAFGLKSIPFEFGIIAFFRILVTLVILLQIDLASGDEPETVCEGCYKIKNTSIFTWFSIFDIAHFYWLFGPIHQLPLNSKVDYLLRTIQRILNFL